jgi:hypothetical protein
VPVVPCSGKLMDQAEVLVRSLFPSMSPIERFSFIAIRRPQSFTNRLLMCFAGVKDLVAFDVYVDENALVLGTTGLYRETGFSLMRLYTSTDPNEASAQRLYERNGFMEVGRKKGLRLTTVFREKKLDQV